jgi:hypothetical protein
MHEHNSSESLFHAKTQRERKDAKCIPKFISGWDTVIEKYLIFWRECVPGESAL